VKSKTLIVIKPDCARNAIMFTETLALVSQCGLRVDKYHRTQRSESFWRIFYAEHSRNPDFPDFDGFVAWMASESLSFIVVEGDDVDAATLVRTKVVPVIRAKYKTSERMNGLHASDSSQSAGREIALTESPFH
jgi:nucleoside diphosphate kinase